MTYVTVTPCRGPHCSASFAWVACLRRDGKLGRAPLNPEPVEPADPLNPVELRGLFQPIADDRVRAAVPGDTGPFFQSHFATCPDAATFRKGRRRDER